MPEMPEKSTTPETPEWDLPDPFFIEVVAGAEHIDSYRHVNNAVYLSWLEACAWAHSEALGYGEARCIEMQRGMAVRNLNLDYLAACYEGDEILVGICRTFLYSFPNRDYDRSPSRAHGSKLGAVARSK